MKNIEIKDGDRKNILRPEIQVSAPKLALLRDLSFVKCM